MNQTWARNTIVILAKVGYLTKGLIFGLVGVLCLMAVWNVAGGTVTDSRGVIEYIAEVTPGRLGVGLLAFGLAAHVVYRFYQALFDPSEKGHSAKALIQRGGLLISSGLYVSLFLVALSYVTGMIGGGGGGSEESGESVLDLPGGQLWLGLIGLGVVATGGYQLWRAWTQPFREKWQPHDLIKRYFSKLLFLASLGITIRALLFFMIGWYLIRAGWFRSSDEIVDTAEALYQIASGNWGRIWLSITAVGLMLYAMYCFLNVMIRKIE